MVNVPDVRIDLDTLNHTELVALANWCGLKAHRGIPRSTLYYHLTKLVPFTEEDPFDGMRGAVSHWLKSYWDRFRLQVGKKVCPNCYECREAQVLHCYMVNSKNL
jgi:hypothetical protein